MTKKRQLKELRVLPTTGRPPFPFFAARLIQLDPMAVGQTAPCPLHECATARGTVQASRRAVAHFRSHTEGFGTGPTRPTIWPPRESLPGRICGRVESTDDLSAALWKCTFRSFFALLNRGVF